MFIGNPFIKLFSSRKITNPIREDGPEEHIVKKIGTPTMGGLIILIGLILSVLMWSDLTNIYVLFSLYIVISFGALGAYDDYQKIRQKKLLWHFIKNKNNYSNCIGYYWNNVFSKILKQ